MKDNRPRRSSTLSCLRYFGLLALGSRRLPSTVFLLLVQKKGSKPARLSWARSLELTFGTNPLIGRDVFRCAGLGA